MTDWDVVEVGIWQGTGEKEGRGKLRITWPRFFSSFLFSPILSIAYVCAFGQADLKPMCFSSLTEFSFLLCSFSIQLAARFADTWVTRMLSRLLLTKFCFVQWRCAIATYLGTDRWSSWLYSQVQHACNRPEDLLLLSGTSTDLLISSRLSTCLFVWKCTYLFSPVHLLGCALTLTAQSTSEDLT